MTNYSRKAMVYPKHVLEFSEMMTPENMTQLFIASLSGVRGEGIRKLLKLLTRHGGNITYIQRRAVENNMNDILVEKLSNMDNYDDTLYILKAYENGMDEENLKRLFKLKGRKKDLYTLAYEEGMSQQQLDQLCSFRSFDKMKVYYTLYKHNVEQEILDKIETEVNLKNMRKFIQKYKKDINLEELFSRLTKDEDYEYKKELLEEAVSMGRSENVVNMMADLDDFDKMFSFDLSYKNYMSEKNLKLLTTLNHSDMEWCRLAYEEKLNNEEFELFTKLTNKPRMFYEYKDIVLIKTKEHLDKESFKLLLNLDDRDKMNDFYKKYICGIESHMKELL